MRLEDRRASKMKTNLCKATQAGYWAGSNDRFSTSWAKLLMGMRLDTSSNSSSVAASASAWFMPMPIEGEVACAACHVQACAA